MNSIYRKILFLFCIVALLLASNSSEANTTNNYTYDKQHKNTTVSIHIDAASMNKLLELKYKQVEKLKILSFHMQQYIKVAKKELTDIKKNIIKQKNKLTNDIQKKALQNLKQSILAAETALNQMTEITNKISNNSIVDLQRLLKQAKGEISDKKQATLQLIKKKLDLVEKKINEEINKLLKNKKSLIEKIMKATFDSTKYLLTIAVTSNKKIHNLMNTIYTLEKTLVKKLRLTTTNIQNFIETTNRELHAIKKKLLENKDTLTKKAQKIALKKLTQSITTAEVTLKQITNLTNNISTNSLVNIQKLLKQGKSELLKGNKAAIQTVKNNIRHAKKIINNEINKLIKNKSKLFNSLKKATYASTHYFLTLAATSNEQIQDLLKTVYSIEKNLVKKLKMVTSNIQKYNKIVETELLTIKKKIIEKKNKLTNNIQKNALYKLNKSITITETALKQITGLVNNISTKSLGDVQKIIKNAKAELTKGNKAAIQTVRKKIMQIEQRIRKEKRELLKKKALLLKQLMKTTYASAQYFLTMAATSNKQIQAIVKSINNIKQKLKDINKITKSLNQYITTIFEEVYNAKNFINEILLVVEKSKKELKDLIDEIEKGYHEKSQHIFKKLKRDLQFIYGIEKDIHKRLKNLNIFLDKLQAIQVKFNRIYELIQKEQLVIFKHFKPIQTLNIQKIKRIPIQIALSLKKLQREVLKFKTLKKDLKNIYTFIQNKAKETVKDGKLVMKKVKNLLTKVGKQSLKIMKWAFFNKLQNIIKIDYANITSPDGIRSHIKVKYHYLENFSTEFLFRYDSRKETSTIAGLSNSILNTSQKNYLLDLYLLQYKHTIIPNKLNVDFGIAANVLNLNNEEKGNFTSGPNETIYSSETKSQEYENKYTIWIYSPRIWFSSSIDFDFIKSNISIDYSPLFFYDYKQTTFISPLVNSGARHTLTFRDNGESYFMGKIALVFFNLIGFEANYEYYRMKFYQITLQSDISTGSVLFNFAPIKSYYAFTDTSLIVNIYYPLFNSLTVKFGVGKRYLKTINDSENQIQNKSDELIINFGLTSTI